MPDTLQSASERTVPPAARSSTVADIETPAPRDGRSALVSRLVGLLHWWRKRSRRLDLATLNDQSLRDLGLERPAMDAGSAMAFWRLR
jgi:uncharacterized protein YjiS (DUF1127 family)